VAAMESWIAII